jgi:hypothetical protein
MKPSQEETKDIDINDSLDHLGFTKVNNTFVSDCNDRYLRPWWCSHLITDHKKKPVVLVQDTGIVSGYAIAPVLRPIILQYKRKRF